MKFVWIAVLLQLCLSVLDVSAGKGAAAREGAGDLPGEVVNENQLRFGDLLLFPEQGYNHYALYVDGVELEGKEKNENIFEMTKKPRGCHFRNFQGPFRRHNYLDADIAPKSRDEMIATIQRLRQDPVCQTYNLFTKNCEQIATKVRYGESHCRQIGALSETGAKILKKNTVHRREASAAA